MKKMLVFVITLGVVGLLVGIGFAALFSDTEVSSGNTFTAGALDLQVDGENPLASAKFSVENFTPGDQSTGSFHLTNVGSINGYVDLEGISVTNHENGCVKPEVDAGDLSCADPGSGEGELQNAVNLHLFVDDGCDGGISTGDSVFYDDLVKNLPSGFDLNESINSGDTLCIVALFDWRSTPEDNLAQSDSIDLDIGFELGQDTGQ